MRSLWRETAELPAYQPLAGDTEADVCVVGAGIAGLSTAYLLARAGNIREAHERMSGALTQDVVRAVVDDVPGEWLGGGADALREGYVRYLMARLHGRLAWVEEAERARSSG